MSASMCPRRSRSWSSGRAAVAPWWLPISASRFRRASLRCSARATSSRMAAPWPARPPAPPLTRTLVGSPDSVRVISTWPASGTSSAAMAPPVSTALLTRTRRFLSCTRAAPPGGPGGGRRSATPPGSFPMLTRRRRSCPRARLTGCPPVAELRAARRSRLRASSPGLKSPWSTTCTSVKTSANSRPWRSRPRRSTCAVPSCSCEAPSHTSTERLRVER
mmetsp:Transcript_21017/g.66583  ORF Transcript_21017/g.66583 Transcript_21017/m.66583 type:complete len:219 (+) Transcript_21017:1547-2203(+)